MDDLEVLPFQETPISKPINQGKKHGITFMANLVWSELPVSMMQTDRALPNHAP